VAEQSYLEPFHVSTISVVFMAIRIGKRAAGARRGRAGGPG
jgi:hypothetical protein